MDSAEETRILVIDDSATFRHTLGLRLQHHQHRVLLASSGHQGIELARGERPDGIVVDLLMPDLDGTETCRQIRSSPEGATVPILMLTASDDIRTRILGRASGADEFLVKGAEFEVVVASVLDFIRRTAPRRHARSPASGPRLAPGPADATDLFAQIVRATGLSRVIAEPALQRACRRAGVDAKGLSAADLERALPAIERSLRIFLPDTDVAERLQAVAALAGRGASSPGNHR